MEDVCLNIAMKVRIALNRNNSNHLTWIFDTLKKQQLLTLTPTQGYFWDCRIRVIALAFGSVHCIRVSFVLESGFGRRQVT